MTRLLMALGVAVMLAGCGAEGDPIPPEPSSDTAIGIGVHGTVSVGITG